MQAQGSSGDIQLINGNDEIFLLENVNLRPFPDLFISFLWTKQQLGQSDNSKAVDLLFLRPELVVKKRAEYMNLIGELQVGILQVIQPDAII